MLNPIVVEQMTPLILENEDCTRAPFRPKMFELVTEICINHYKIVDHPNHHMHRNVALRRTISEIMICVSKKRDVA